MYQFGFGSSTVNSMMCPDLSGANYTLQGDDISTKYKIFQFSIGLCSEG